MAGSGTVNPIGAITGLVNTFNAGKDARWGQGSLINVLNTMNGANELGVGLGTSAFDPSRDFAMGGGGLAQNLLGSPVGGLGAQQQSIQDFLSGLNPGIFQQGGLTGRNGANLDYVANNAANQTIFGNNGLNSGSDAYQSLLRGGGSPNSQSQDALGQLAELLRGGGTNGDLKSLGIQAGANNGLSGYDSRLQSIGDYMLSRGGYDQNLNNLASAANTGLQGANGVPGLTQTGAQGEGASLAGFLGGGNTATTDQLQQIGTNFAGQQALLPTGMVAGFAKDQAGTQARKAAESFQAQALARGGGAGATVANGAQNQGLADFDNNINEAQANAFQNALTQQQGLNLQQQGQGAQMALGGGNLAASRLGTYGNLLNSLEGTANQRYGIAGNLLGNAAQGATSNASTYGNLGVQGGNTGNNRLSIAQNALNNTTGNQLGAANGISGLSQSQIQAILGAGSGLNANAGTANSAYNNLVNNQLGSGTLGNTQGNSFYNQVGNLLGLGNNSQQNNLTLNGQSLANLLGLSGQGFNYAQSGLSGQAGLFTDYARQALGNKQGAWNGLVDSTAIPVG